MRSTGDQTPPSETKIEGARIPTLWQVRYFTYKRWKKVKLSGRWTAAHLVEGEVAAQLAGELLHPLDGYLGGVVKVVDHDGLITSKEKLEHSVAPDVAGATGDEDGAGHISGSPRVEGKAALLAVKVPTFNRTAWRKTWKADRYLYGQSWKGNLLDLIIIQIQSTYTERYNLLNYYYFYIYQIKLLDYN